MEELDLKEYFKYLFNNTVLAFLIIMLTLIVGLSYSNFLKKPMYKTYTTIVLTAEQGSTTITQNDLMINKNLVTTYSNIVKSKRILKEVKNNLNLDMSVEELDSKVSVQAITDTEIIKVIVTSDNREEVATIANEVANVFSKQVVNIYQIKNINIIDKADKPAAPYNMGYVKDVIIYILIGIVLSVIMITIKYYLDTGVKSIEQIENKFKLPMLGSIVKRSYKKKGNDKNEELIVHANSKSIVSEGIKTVRTNLQFSSVDKKLKSILVTSSIPGEGKSFVSANLATAFAQNGNRVLLVDCDLRKGRQHYVFNVKNDRGLSNLLISNNEISYNQFFKKTPVTNLYLLTMGTIPPNPSELLGSIKNRKLTKLLNEHFDIVIYDGVPVNGLPDSLVMSKLVDKVVVVTELKQTPFELLENTVKSLQKVNADIAGIVVNKVASTGKNSYTYGNYYGYYK